jgi:hypothetical protein
MLIAEGKLITISRPLIHTISRANTSLADIGVIYAGCESQLSTSNYEAGRNSY